MFKVRFFLYSEFEVSSDRDEFVLKLINKLINSFGFGVRICRLEFYYVFKSFLMI